MTDWRKVVTRETTLLERYLRMVGYSFGVGEISKVKAKNIITISRDSVSEQYFDASESGRTGEIALKEYSWGKPEKLFNEFGVILTSFLRLINKIKKLDNAKNKNLIILFEKFLKQYGFGRGIVYYGHIAEAVFSKRLKNELKKSKIKKIDEYFSVLTSPTKIYRGLEKFLEPPKILARRQKKLLREITLTGEAKKLIIYLQWLSYYHEVGERVTSAGFKQLDHLLQLISRQTAVETDDLKYYILPEIKNLLLKQCQLSKQEINSRKEFFVLLMAGGDIKLYTGNKGRVVEKREIPKQKIEPTDILKGQVACLGKKVAGVVRIIRKQEEISKMKKENILVSPMTTPRLMFAIKLAGAIITDEGGITSHAAIISRELNIPCIIGTKIATKVLHDGDFVEVDADKGVVRILKKK